MISLYEHPLKHIHEGYQLTFRCIQMLNAAL